MRRAFTLVEILVVVGIVALLAAIAIPNALRMRITASETAALQGIRTIQNACQVYMMDNGFFPENLIDLAEPVERPPYIDAQLGTGRKQGYEFILSLEDDGHFTLNANPLGGLSRGRYFYTDESGVVYANSEVPAGPDDEVVK